MTSKSFTSLLIPFAILLAGCREPIGWDETFEQPVYPPFEIKSNINIITLYDGMESEPGDTIEIKWNSYNNLKKVDIYLYRKATQKITIATGLKNSFKYNWVIPLEIPHSLHYHIKIVNHDNPEDYKMGDRFSIIKR